jgi:hypothetical protein
LTKNRQTYHTCYTIIANCCYFHLYIYIYIYRRCFLFSIINRNYKGTASLTLPLFPLLLPNPLNNPLPRFGRLGASAFESAGVDSIGPPEGARSPVPLAGASPPLSFAGGDTGAAGGAGEGAASGGEIGAGGATGAGTTAAPLYRRKR